MRLHTPSVSALAYFPLSPPKVSYVRIASLLSCRKRVMALALNQISCGCINGLVIFCIRFSFPTPWHDKDSDPSDSFLTPYAIPTTMARTPRAGKDGQLAHRLVAQCRRNTTLIIRLCFFFWHVRIETLLSYLWTLVGRQVSECPSCIVIIFAVWVYGL